MATTKLYLDLRGKAKDGNGSIVIVISHNRTTTTVATGIRVSPDEWDGDKVIRRQDAGLLNVELAKAKNKVDTHIALLRLESGFESMTAPKIKSSFTKPKEQKPDTTTSVVALFEEYLRQDISDGTRRLYRSTCDKVIRYSGLSTKIEDIDYKWLINFDRFLAQTRGINGKSIDLRNLRAICNYALKTGITDRYAFAQFSIKQEPTKKRCIPIEKLREFKNYPCTPRQAMFRDYFFLMFYLIGINAADLFLAKKDSIVNGRFEYIRKKTHKKYSIKIEPEAQELLNKYAGRNYLVEAMDHCKDYQNFLHEMNDAIGMIGPTETVENYDLNNLFEQAKLTNIVKPIIPNITSYYARHTWATLAYELDISLDIISQALGHSFGNKTTMIYIRQDQSKVDNANRKVMDFLLMDPERPA